MADSLRQSSSRTKQRLNVKDKWLFRNIKYSPFVCPPLPLQKTDYFGDNAGQFLCGKGRFWQGILQVLTDFSV